MAASASPASYIGRGYIQIVPTTRGGLKGLNKEMEDLQGAKFALNPDLKTGKLKAGLGETFKSSTRVLGAELNKAGNKFNRNMKVGALGVGAVLTGVIAKSVQGGFKRLSNIEGAENMLEGLKMDAKQIKAVRDSALSSVKGTAFGLDSAVQIAGTAVAAGIEVESANGKLNLESYLKLIGDVSQQTGGELSEIGSIFNKVTASGKATASEINQLSDRGLPIRSWLQESTGKSSDEVNKMVREGKIGTEELAEAITKNIGGAALKAGDTTSGAFANMESASGRFGAVLLGGVYPQLKGVAQEITNFFDKAATHVEPIITRLTDKLGPKFQAAIEGSGEKLSNFLFGEGGGTNWAEYAIEGLTSALKTATEVSASFLEALEPFKPVFGALGDVIEKNPEMVGKLIAYASLANLAFGAIGSVVTAVGSIVTIVGALGGLGAVLVGILPIIAAIGAGIALGWVIASGADWLVKNWEDVKEFFSLFHEALNDLLASAATKLGEALGGWLGKSWTEFKEALSDFWSKVQGFFQGIDNYLAGVAEGVGERIGALLLDVWTDIQWVMEAVPAFFAIINESLERAANWIGEKLGAIFAASWNGIQWLKGAVPAFFGWISEGLARAAEVIGERLGSLFAEVWAGLKGVGEGIAGIFNNIVNGIIWVLNKGIEGINALTSKANQYTPGFLQIGQIPTIPSLATGGLVTKSTLAIVGDTPTGEYVIDRGVMDKYLRSNSDTGGTNTNNGIGELHVHIEGKTGMSVDELAGLLPPAMDKALMKSRRR